MDKHILEEINDLVGIRGIVQVGSNIGQEIPGFRNFTDRIVCFEPVLEVFETLCISNTDLLCFNFGLGDKNGVYSMNIASNNAESSSFLIPKNHVSQFSWVTFDEIRELEVRRFDSLDLDISSFNVIFSDTQGFELSVLRGFGDKIQYFDAIYVEYIDSELYEGDATIDEIRLFLESENFYLNRIIPEGKGWGNALFIKNKTKIMDIDSLEHFYTLKPDVLEKYRSDVFFETGTYLGDSVRLALDIGFKKVVSIELVDELQQRNRELFTKEITEGRLELLVGDTLMMIDEVLGEIEGRITFWLDSHQDSGPQGVNKCPLYQELDAIARLSRNDHNIMIDDMRCLQNPGVFPWAEGITLNGIYERLSVINPDYKFKFEDGYTSNDVLVAYI